MGCEDCEWFHICPNEDGQTCLRKWGDDGDYDEDDQEEEDDDG